MILINELLRAGLLQFGLFDNVPFQLNLRMLPSYPDVLRELAAQAQAQVDLAPYDHIVCTANSVPFGVALSLASDVPLVYSRGTDLPPVHDLIGAYDVGHPALLVTNAIYTDLQPLTDLIEKAERGGLEIANALTAFNCRTKPAPPDLAVTALFDMAALVDELARRGQLPPGQARAVQEWLARSSGR